MIEYTDIERLKIGMDESFSFHCLECGNCCRHREDILLSPLDLYRIAGALEMDADAVIEKYCETYIGSSSLLPIVRLKPKGENRVCPLLKKSKCLVHTSKPTVCALYPIGRIYNPQDDTYTFVHNPVRCAAKDRSQTVRQWVTQFGLDETLEESQAWHSLTVHLSQSIRDLTAFVSSEAMQPLWSVVFSIAYTGYDIGRPFMEQFEQRDKQLRELLEQFKQHLNSLSPNNRKDEKQ